jgi:hypothetical protein
MTSPTSADFVTRHEFELAMARIDGRFDQLDAQLEASFAKLDARFVGMDAQMNARFAAVDAGSARSQASLEARIERAMAASIRWTVGVSFGLYALMFGLILFVVSRELPHT